MHPLQDSKVASLGLFWTKCIELGLLCLSQVLERTVLHPQYYKSAETAEEDETLPHSNTRNSKSAAVGRMSLLQKF